MLKLTTTSYLHLFNTLNFNIFVHKSRSNARGIQLVFSPRIGHDRFLAKELHADEATLQLAKGRILLRCAIG